MNTTLFQNRYTVSAQKTLNPHLENNPNDAKWLPMSEAAKLTPYSAEYLSLLARKKKLTSKKIGNVWYTTKPILEAYMNKQMLRADLQQGNQPSGLPNLSTPQIDKSVDQALRPSVDLDKQEANLSKVRSMQSDLRKHEEKQISLGQTETVGENFNLTRDKSEIKKDAHHLGEIEAVFQKVIHQNFLNPESKIRLPSKPPVLKTHFKRAFGTKVLMAATLISILSLTILPVPFAFSLFEKTYESAKSAWNDANTVMGFRPGVGKNQILLLDDTGSISIMGHIETSGQFRSHAADGVAPIVVDSKTEIKNLNAEYLNNMHSADFTLAFVTKNGSVTTEDVKLDGQVEVGQTLLVRGATKLLSALRVDGDLRVFGAAEFDQTLKVVGPALFEGVLQAKGDVTAGGNLSIRKNANIRGALEVGSAVLAKSGSFGSLGVSDGLSAKGKINLGSTKENLIIDAKNLSVDKNGNAAFDGSLILGGDLTSSGSVTFPSLTVTNSTTTNAFVSSLIASNSTTTNATTTNLFATSGTFGDILVTGDSRVDGNFTVGGDTTTIGQLVSTRVPTLAHTFLPSWPSGASNASDATIYINPASAVADTNIFAAAVGGSVKFLVDAEGDVYANSLVLLGSVSQGETTISGNLTVQDNSTFGDAATDITTVNSQLNVLASTTLANLNFLNATGTSLSVTNLSATNSNLTDSTSTNFYSSSLTASNATSTNFFANKLSSLLATITSLVANDISVGALTATSSTAINSTTTNATSTQAFISSLITSNSTSTTSSITSLAATNATTTNIFSTTASSTNFFSTLGNIGTLTSGLINGQTISSAANFTGSLAVAGAVTGSTYNGLTISGSGGALTIPTSSSLIRSGAHALTLTTTASTNVTLPTSGTLYGTLANSITSADLLTSVSNETGSGSLVFGTSPALTTPNIGAATGSSLNLSSGAITSGLINGQTISSAANFTGSLAVAGNVTQNIGSYIYPGSSSGLTNNQTSYYLSSNATWGLYTNTSLNAQGLYDTGSRVCSAQTCNISTTAITSGLINGQTISSAANFTGTLATAGTINANGGLSQDGNVILNGSDTWLRTTNATGWYNSTYSVGVYATQNGRVDLYNGAGLYVPGTITGASTLAITGAVTGSSFSGAGTGLTGTASSLTAGSANAVSFNGGLTTASSPTFTGMTVGSGNIKITGTGGVILANLTGSGQTCTSSIEGKLVYAIYGGNTYGTLYNCRRDTAGGTYDWVTIGAGGPQALPDVAEYVRTNDLTIESGTLVSVSEENYYEDNKYNRFLVERANPENASRVIGIISPGGGLVLNPKPMASLDENTDPNLRPITLAGRVPVKITEDNGPIQKGDYLTVSPTNPGYMSKAVKSGMVFAQALENSSGTGEILAFIVHTYYIPGQDLDLRLSDINMTLASTTEAIGLNLADASAGLDISRDVIIRGALKVDHIGAIGDILSLESDVEFIGRPYFNSDTGGIAIIQKDSRQVDVVFDKEYSDAPVISASVTLNASTTASQSDNILSNGVHYVVTNRSGSGFSILLSGPAPEDMQFSWIALAIKNLRISSSSNATQPEIIHDDQLPISNGSSSTSPDDSAGQATTTSSTSTSATGGASSTSASGSDTSSSTPVTTTADTNATSTPPVDASSTPPTSTESGVGAPTESVGADSTTTTSTSTPTSTVTPTDTSSSTPTAI